jgi:hypothetical protein
MRAREARRGLTRPPPLAFYLDDPFKRHQLWGLLALRFNIGPE